MKKVTIELGNIVQLLDFLDLTKATNCEINRRHLTLICELSPADIEVATRSYGGRVLAHHFSPNK